MNQTKTAFTFDAQLVGECEGRGWRAYYERDWTQMMCLMVQRLGAMYHLPSEVAQQVATLSVQAAREFAPIDHDLLKVHETLTRYYQLVRQFSGLAFDPARAAELEAEYWDVHRRLVGKPDKTEFVNTLTELHSHIFGITHAQARESAELRVLANNVVDDITQKNSLDPEIDWMLLESYLCRCYSAILKHMS